MDNPMTGTDLFHFRQFSITQSRSAMKVGVDAVLFAAWIVHEAPLRILDIGCGTGVIALITAARFESAMIDAIDIDPGSVQDAAENIRNSSFHARIHLSATSLQEFMPETHFDLIVSNPPFFNEAVPAENIQRHRARHDDTLPPSALFTFASKHLQEKGKLCVIYPATRKKEILELSEEHGLHLSRLCSVKKMVSAPARLVFAAFGSETGNPVMEEICIYESAGIYSTTYKNLVQPFYMNNLSA